MENQNLVYIKGEVLRIRKNLGMIVKESDPKFPVLNRFNFRFLRVDKDMNNVLEDYLGVLEDRENYLEIDTGKLKTGRYYFSQDNGYKQDRIVVVKEIELFEDQSLMECENKEGNMMKGLFKEQYGLTALYRKVEEPLIGAGRLNESGDLEFRISNFSEKSNWSVHFLTTSFFYFPKT